MKPMDKYPRNPELLYTDGSMDLFVLDNVTPMVTSAAVSMQLDELQGYHFSKL